MSQSQAFSPHMTMITLGVRNLSVSNEFYEKLGFKRASSSNDNVSFFHMNGTILGLFGRDDLAKDAGVEASEPGFSGVALAHNLASEAAVVEAYAHAIACGATPTKRPEKVFWGGYSGYFADPDGHLWELAYNPYAALTKEGHMVLARSDHDNYSDAAIRKILDDTKTIAMVGASANSVRPSYFVLKYLLKKGYDVTPINPGQAGKEICGQMTYSTLQDLPNGVDMIDIFRPNSAIPGIVDEILALPQLPKTVWMQLSIRDDASAARLEAAGIDVVMDRCPKIEYARLSREIAWNGIVTGQISSRRPILRTGFQSFGLRKN